MALPIPGTWEVVIAPTICAMNTYLLSKHCLEGFHRHSGLRGAVVLDFHMKDPRQFREVVDIAAGMEHAENVTVPDSFALFRGQIVFGAIPVLIAEEFV